MKERVVSIVIPTYNVEPYIRQCLDSILSQTYKSTEIIIIDDGSTDHTPDIINDYVKQNNNIIFFSQKNSGQSVARNVGINKSTGEFLIFVDSDDWLPSQEVVAEMVEYITTNNCDYVQGGLSFIKDGIITKYYIPNKRTPIRNQEILKAAIQVDGLYTGPVAKIYRTDFIKSNSLYFIEGYVNEDTAHSILISALASKVGFINKIVYCIREREGSTSRTDFKRMIGTMHEVLTTTQNKLAQIGLYKDNADIFIARYLRSLLYNLLQSAQRSKYKDFLSDWRYCIDKTNYIKYSHHSKFLTLPHRSFYIVSRIPLLFYSSFRALNLLGLKMH